MTRRWNSRDAFVAEPERTRWSVVDEIIVVDDTR
jgi:hypothetical protein